MIRVHVQQTVAHVCCIQISLDTDMITVETIGRPCGHFALGDRRSITLTEYHWWTNVRGLPK